LRVHKSPRDGGRWIKVTSEAFLRWVSVIGESRCLTEKGKIHISDQGLKVSCPSGLFLQATSLFKIDCGPLLTKQSGNVSYGTVEGPAQVEGN
jgi:hypothetical protein